MRAFFLILGFSFLLINARAEGLLTGEAVLIAQQDTSGENDLKEVDVIDEIIETKKIPPKEKVEYVSQLTRYGFKNLFTRYGYNSSLPYSSQVNPNAEAYMQDYLRSHTNSLVKMKSWGVQYFNLIDNIFLQHL